MCSVQFEIIFFSFSLKMNVFKNHQYFEPTVHSEIISRYITTVYIIIRDSDLEEWSSSFLSTIFKK